MTSDQNRRKFLGTAAATAAFTIVPRHVLGAPYVAPSDKINLAYIGTGTQGLREMVNLLPVPEIQIVSVCDPNKDAADYRDWSPTGLLRNIRQALGKPDWWAGADGTIPGGRDVGQNVVETFYGSKRPSGEYKGCSTYADFRELLDREKDVDAVKIMTPDHLHATIAIAAMKKGKHVMVHKPIANRLREAKMVLDTARKTGVATHFLPWDANGSMEQVMGWIDSGAIGTLREVHNWTNRPVWPQYPTLPDDTPPVPAGFDWNLWLGPEADRPYHPHYTNMVFRGWFDFGGGSMADMGHYSLWTVFNALELSGPTSVYPMLTHHCMLRESVSRPIDNNFSFPEASVVRFKYPAHGSRPAIDLIWYEGGMLPNVPEELERAGEELPREGMMFTGDKGQILAGFHVESPWLLSKPKPAPERRQRGQQQHGQGGLTPGVRQWVAACRGGKQSAGNFLNAWPITEAVNLYAVALRTRQRLKYDAQEMKITNHPEANQHLERQYRKGWELESA